MIVVDQAGFSYSGENYIFSNVSFELKNREILAILGRNGVGKTTFLKCLAGIYKWSSGTSYFVDEKNPLIGYVPQAKALSFSYEVRDFIVFGRCASNGFFAAPSQEDYKKVDEVLLRLNIEKLALRSCNLLSGGELQMAYLAKALVSQPNILILDEPELNLDFFRQKELMEILQTYRLEGGTVIMNSHCINNVLNFADKCLLIGEKEYRFGDASSVLTEENFEKFFCIKAYKKNWTLEGKEKTQFVFF